MMNKHATPADKTFKALQERVKAGTISDMGASLLLAFSGVVPTGKTYVGCISVLSWLAANPEGTIMVAPGAGGFDGFMERLRTINDSTVRLPNSELDRCVEARGIQITSVGVSTELEGVDTTGETTERFVGKDDPLIITASD